MGSVLVVDDQQMFLNAVTQSLLREGYTVIAASSGREALERLRVFRGEIELLVTDIAMPDMNGLALAERVTAESSSIRVLLMSAHLSVSSPFPLLRKPFRMRELLQQVSIMINRPSRTVSRTCLAADRAPGLGGE